MHVAPARKEKTRVYFLPRTRAAGYLGNCEWKVCGNQGTNVFLNAEEFLEAHYLLGVLDASFIVFVSVFTNKTKKQVNV